jgi:hypothetical protein
LNHKDTEDTKGIVVPMPRRKVAKEIVVLGSQRTQRTQRAQSLLLLVVFRAWYARIEILHCVQDDMGGLVLPLPT